MLISKTRKRLALSLSNITYTSTKRNFKFPKLSKIFFLTKLKPKLLSWTHKIKFSRKFKCTKKKFLLLSSSKQPERERLKKSSSKLKTTFSLHDSVADGRVNPEDLGVMIRTLGGNPAEAQVDDNVRNESLNGPFDFHRFMGLMRKHLRARPMDPDLHRALEAIDNDVDGYINVEKLRHIFTIMGDSLEPDELDEWIRAIGIRSQGNVSYEAIITPIVKTT